MFVVGQSGTINLSMIPAYVLATTCASTLCTSNKERSIEIGELVRKVIISAKCLAKSIKSIAVGIQDTSFECCGLLLSVKLHIALCLNLL